MSPDSSPVSAVRPLIDQARALVGFLLAHDHKLAESDSQRLCADLPLDPKAAAKQLRVGLAPLAVDIKHTHALKAVAVLRGSARFLDLGAQTQYVVADWSPDAPGVSADPVRLTSFAKAADQFCRRLCDQFENDPPLVVMRCRRTHVSIRATSRATSAWWSLLLVPVDAAGVDTVFEDRKDVERLTERVRRLVEGGLAGWVDGLYNVYQVSAEADDDVLDGNSILESEFPAVDQLPAVTDDSPAEGLPIRQEEWQDFLKRDEFFRRRKEVPLAQWAREMRLGAAVPRYGDVVFDQDAFEQARSAAGLTWSDIAELFQDDLNDEIVQELQVGKACLSSLQVIAEALDIDPNSLLTSQRSTPRIPLPLHSDIAMWLSRIDAVVSEPHGSAPAPAGIAERLRALCAVPLDVRRHWDKKPPAALEELNREIRFAGLIVCAGMGVRFVHDLPLGLQRPTSISILEFDRQIDVLTQGGQLPDGVTSMQLEPESDPVTPEWLARFNKPHFTANDLLRYSDMVHEHTQEDDDWKDRFTTKAFVGVKLFNKDAEKAHAATVRMTALSRLIERRPMEPWVRKNRDPQETSLMIAEAGFEAAARCELVDVDGEPGFDDRTFYMLCVKHARKYN